MAKKLSTKIKVPGAKNTGLSLRGTTKPKKNARIYTKDVLLQDATKFTNVGFGNTGMDGEN